MSCLSTRYKLVTLCCCATIIAIVSSVMVINAFLNWSDNSHISATQVITMPGDAVAVTTDRPELLIPLNKNAGLDIEIKIDEVTPSTSGSTTVLRKWLELQKYNSNKGNKDKPNHPSEIVVGDDIIDIDDDAGQEISGSGMDDNEKGDDEVSYIPLVTGKSSSTQTIPQDTTKQSRTVNATSPTHTASTTNSASRSTSTSHSTTASTLTTSDSTSSKRPLQSTLPSTNVSGSGDFSLIASLDHTHSSTSALDEEADYHIGSSVTQPEVPDEDKCDKWLNCEDPFLETYTQKFALLPTCSCEYPLTQRNTVYDDYHKKIFNWTDSKYSSSYLYAYHSGAARCIRSAVGRGTLSAQNCCYDKNDLLITRGPGAGTPDIISPDVSSALHQLVDTIPWILCRGDWLRYNVARPPNNMRACTENPKQMEYIYQIWLTKKL